jgi:hypothetical protein
MLVLALNKNLQLFLQTQDKTLNLASYLGPNLELYTKFEEIWKKTISKNLPLDKKILFVIGSEAGFTDTRIVFIWLKSLDIFRSKQYIFAKYFEEKIDFDSEPEKLLINLDLISAKSAWSDTLTVDVYSRQPTIGKANNRSNKDSWKNLIENMM